MPLRKGFVFTPGHWNWVSGRWTWMPGKYEAIRVGQRWREPRWENQGGVWIKIDGGWIPEAGVVVAAYPTSAPPALQSENFGAPRAGFVWIRGRWDWQNGNWAWVAGHWERERANYRWADGRWEQRGNQWVWVEGSWQAYAPPPPPAPPPAGPIIRDHR